MATNPSASLSSSSPTAARQSAEAYIGRPLSNAEYDQLVRATYAEADTYGDEAAMVAASILNRARDAGTTVTAVLNAKNQFQSVTGVPGNRTPSENYTQGPGANTRAQIENGLVSVLPNVSHKQTDFTSANPAAYGPGTDIGVLRKAQSDGYSVVGGSVFNTSLGTAPTQTASITPPLPRPRPGDEAPATQVAAIPSKYATPPPPPAVSDNPNEAFHTGQIYGTNSTIPQGPYGADGLARALLTGDQAQIKAASDAIQKAAFDKYGLALINPQLQEAVKGEVKNYLTQTLPQEAPGAVRSLQALLAKNPDMTAGLNDEQRGMLKDAIGNIAPLIEKPNLRPNQGLATNVAAIPAGLASSPPPPPSLPPPSAYVGSPGDTALQHAIDAYGSPQDAWRPGALSPLLHMANQIDSQSGAISSRNPNFETQEAPRTGSITPPDIVPQGPPNFGIQPRDSRWGVPVDQRPQSIDDFSLDWDTYQRSHGMPNMRPGDESLPVQRPEILSGFTQPSANGIYKPNLAPGDESLPYFDEPSFYDMPPPSQDYQRSPPSVWDLASLQPSAGAPSPSVWDKGLDNSPPQYWQPPAPGIDPNDYDPLANASIYNTMLPRDPAPRPVPTPRPTQVSAPVQQSQPQPSSMWYDPGPDQYAQPGTENNMVLPDLGSYGDTAFQPFSLGYRRGGRRRR